MKTYGHKHAHQRKDMKHADKKLPRPGLHKDWRTWVVIGLMLAAIGIYVLTLDDSMQPDSAASDGIPAASETAKPQN